MIDKNGILSQKTTFKGFDQIMMGLNFKNVFDSESGATNSSKSKSNWKKDLCGVKKLEKVFQCLECNNGKICDQCEIKSKINGFECELVRVCEKCMKKNQIIYYRTEINKLKRSPESEFG